MFTLLLLCCYRLIAAVYDRSTAGMASPRGPISRTGYTTSGSGSSDSKLDDAGRWGQSRPPADGFGEVTAGRQVGWGDGGGVGVSTAAGQQRPSSARPDTPSSGGGGGDGGVESRRSTSIVAGVGRERPRSAPTSAPEVDDTGAAYDGAWG